MVKQKRHGIIYKATNKINGKVYIGQTIQSLKERMHAHIRNALNNTYNSHFHRAIRKYTEENFIWEIIIECNSLEELNKIEIEMIEKYSTFENGYNSTEGGEGIVRYKHTEETKKKMSESREGKRNSFYDKHHTEETKRKIGVTNKGEKHYNYGKHRSEETKKKIGDANRGEKCYNYGKRGRENPGAKKYIITTPEGEEIFVHGITEFCKNYKEEKLNFKHLVSVAQGKRRHHKDYKCRYFIDKEN